MLPEREDIDALLALLESEDTPRIKHALQTVGCLKSAVEEDSPKEILKIIVCRDKTFTCFYELYHHFLEHGFDDIAAQFLRYFEITSGKSGAISLVRRSSPVDRVRPLNNIYRWQGMFHDGQFHDPLQFCRALSANMKMKWKNESNGKRKLLYADNCEYLQILELDTIMSNYDISKFDEKLFQRIHSFSNQTTSAPTFDALCCVRKSLTRAYAAEFAAAEDLANYAKFLAEFGSAPVEYANVLYYIILCKLCRIQHSPTTKLKESLLKDGERALSMLISDPSDEKNLVTKRVILLRMAFCLLGIGLNGNVSPNYQVSQSDLEKAETFLAEIEMTGVVARRKMFHYITQSRVYELRGYLWVALKTMSQASSVAKNGHFEEAGVIDSYLFSLLKRLNQCEDKITTRRHSV